MIFTRPGFIPVNAHRPGSGFVPPDPVDSHPPGSEGLP